MLYSQRSDGRPRRGQSKARQGGGRRAKGRRVGGQKGQKVSFVIRFFLLCSTYYSLRSLSLLCLPVLPLPPPPRSVHSTLLHHAAAYALYCLRLSNRKSHYKDTLHCCCGLYQPQQQLLSLQNSMSSLPLLLTKYPPPLPSASPQPPQP